MTAFSPRQTTPFAESRLSRAWDAGHERPARQPVPFGAVGRAFAAAGAGLREYVRRQRVMGELSRLTDRELADIGLSRTDIGELFTPAFAARRRAERGA